MFMKQYNYKPRSNSQSSGTSSAAAGSPPKDATKPAAVDTSTAHGAATAGRRRSSASEQFGGLSAHKRGSTDDQRKASWTDQKPGGTGILGGMWNSFTKGK